MDLKFLQEEVKIEFDLVIIASSKFCCRLEITFGDGAGKVRGFGSNRY